MTDKKSNRFFIFEDGRMSCSSLTMIEDDWIRIIEKAVEELKELRENE